MEVEGWKDGFRMVHKEVTWFHAILTGSQYILGEPKGIE